MPNPYLRRLERIERREGVGGGIQLRPCVRIITESDEDRDRQLAALEAASLYTPGRGLLIDRRIVDPKPSVLQ